MPAIWVSDDAARELKQRATEERRSILAVVDMMIERDNERADVEA